MPNAYHPRPFNPAIDMDFKEDQSLWYARPQLIFSVTVCPTEQNDRRELHEIFDLVYSTTVTLEAINLTPNSVMQRNGVPMLFETSGTEVPTLYLAPLNCVLGRVPLMPCYLRGNDTPIIMIPHCFRNGSLP